MVRIASATLQLAVCPALEPFVGSGKIVLGKLTMAALVPKIVVLASQRRNKA